MGIGTSGGILRSSAYYDGLPYRGRGKSRILLAPERGADWRTGRLSAENAP